MIGVLFVLSGLEYDGGVCLGIDCCYSLKSLKLTWQASLYHSSMMLFQSFSSCAVSIHSERGTCWDTWSWRASWSDLIMVLHRVDCGLPLFHGFLTEVVRSQCSSLFIGILAILPLQQRDLLMRKIRISGTLAHFQVWALVILYSLTLHKLMFSMFLRLQ